MNINSVFILDLNPGVCTNKTTTERIAYEKHMCSSFPCATATPYGIVITWPAEDRQQKWSLKTPNLGAMSFPRNGWNHLHCAVGAQIEIGCEISTAYWLSNCSIQMKSTEPVKSWNAWRTWCGISALHASCESRRHDDPATRVLQHDDSK